MRVVINYERVLLQIKGRWRFVYRPVYKKMGKGAALESRKKGNTISIEGLEKTI